MDDFIPGGWKNYEVHKMDTKWTTMCYLSPQGGRLYWIHKVDDIDKSKMDDLILREWKIINSKKWTSLSLSLQIGRVS